VDRPLTRAKDFERWMGFDAKVELKEQLEGRRRFRGKLETFDGNNISILTDDEGKVEINIDDIAKAKLLLTDELLDAVQKQRQNQETK